MINNVKRSINQGLTERTQRIFNGQPWHGRSLMQILEMKDVELPVHGIKILLHMIAWRNFVTEALKGNESTILLNSEEDWPTERKSFKEVKAEFIASHEALIDAIETFPDSKWSAKPEDAKYTFYELCEGIIDHDIYHSAQVAMIFKESNE